MATRGALLLGVALVTAAICGATVSATNQLDPLANKMYHVQAPMRQDQTRVTMNVSSQCKAEVERLLGDPKTLETDAVMALDAFGKPAAGILQLNLAWLGHYDECKAIKGFNYCLADMSLNLTSLTSKTNQSVFAGMQELSITWGICPPANCSEQDIYAVLKDLLGALKILESINISANALSASSVVCTKDPPIPYNAGFICTVTLCFFILSLMVFGALYDEYLQLRAKMSLRGRGASHPWSLLSLTSAESDEDDDEPLITDVGTASSVNSDISMPTQQSLAVRLLLCFAMNRNLAKLMDVRQGDSSIGALNGIRVISMFWVILGHTVFFGFTINITDNTLTFVSWVKTHVGFQAVANAFFSVDTFFFLSGFLLAYLTFARFRELKTVKTWALFYFHRYWRLTPLFAFTILIWMYLSQFFGEGPVWQRSTMRQNCPKYWWSGLLYISNFWPKSFAAECIGWTWYLANDMQFFIISPLLMAPLYYFPVLGWLVLIATLLASFLSTGLIIGLYDLDVNFLDSLAGQAAVPIGEDYFSLVYAKPYCRIAPYLVGMGLGYIMHRIGKRRVNMSPVLALIGWLAAAGMAMSVVYGLYSSNQSSPMSKAASIVYGSISRFVWALSLAWVVYACKYGYGGWINSFLSWDAWVPLGRVTFSAYMIHPIVIQVFYNNFATSWHFSVYLVAFYFAVLVSVSYFIAVFLSLAVEYPFANLEKLLLQPPSRAKTTKRNGLAAATNGEMAVAKPLIKNEVVANGFTPEKGFSESNKVVNA